MKCKYNPFILGVLFTYAIWGSCGPAHPQNEVSWQQRYTQKLTEKLVLEIHRSLYGSYKGLNLKNHYGGDYQPGFGLNKGKLISDLDSNGNEIWALQIDTVVNFMSSKSFFPTSALKSKIRYNLHCSSEKLGNRRQGNSYSRMNKGYTVILASSKMTSKKCDLVFNGGIQIWSEMSQLENSQETTPLYIQLAFHSLAFQDTEASLEDGKIQFNIIGINAEKNSWIYKGWIQFYPNHAARILVGNHFYVADFKTGKISNI